LTGRAFVVLITLGVIVVTLALPVREWFAQRALLASIHDENAARAGRVEDLQKELARLKDRAYVTALIRDRLHYVLPGEVGYVVLDPNSAPAAGSSQGVSASRTSSDPWYSTLWGSVQAADGTAPAAVTKQVRPDAPR
jgi:cell division protein FtsB